MAGVQLPSIDLAFGFDFLRERSLSVDAGLGRVGTSATGPFASADTSRRLQPGWGHWQTTRQGITDASPASASAPHRIDDLDVSRGVGLLGSASLRILSMIPFQTGAAECGVRLRTDQDCPVFAVAGGGRRHPAADTSHKSQVPALQWCPIRIVSSPAHNRPGSSVPLCPPSVATLPCCLVVDELATPRDRAVPCRV
jgi:hypothetical protein